MSVYSASARASSCSDNRWTPLSVEEIDTRGLSHLVELLKLEALTSLELERFSTEITIIITNCSVQGQPIRTIKYPRSALFFSREHPVLKRGFAIHLTTAFAQRDLSDLRHRIQKEACLIAHGIADNPERTLAQERSRTIKTCMHRVALQRGDYDYARWIARTISPQDASLAQRIAQIRKRISFLFSTSDIPSEYVRRIEMMLKKIEKHNQPTHAK